MLARDQLGTTSTKDNKRENENKNKRENKWVSTVMRRLSCVSQFFVSPTSPTYKELEEYNNQQELAELRKEDNRLRYLLNEYQHEIRKLEKERHQQVSFLVSEFSDVIMHMIILAEAPDDEHRLDMMQSEVRHLNSIISRMDTDEKRSREIWMIKKSVSLLITAVKSMKMRMRDNQ